MEKVATNGIFAVLFVSLLLYVLKQNKDRESRLISVLETLSEAYSKLHEEVCGIRDCLNDVLGKSKQK